MRRDWRRVAGHPDSPVFARRPVGVYPRSSPRIRHWLLNHPTYGPPLHNWQRHGAISKKAKTAALIGMGLSLVVTGWITASIMILAMQAAILGLVALYILTRPSRVPAR